VQTAIIPPTENTAEQNQKDVFMPSVMFVAESIETRQYLRELFRREKYHLRFYSRTEFAIENFKKVPVDLLVLVPEEQLESHLDFVKKVQESRPDIRIIMVLSQENEPKVIEALANGKIHKVLIQPVPNDLLKSVVDEMVQLHYNLRFEAMEKKLASFRSIPAPSRFQDRMRQLLIKRDRSMRELVTEIEKNPALVAKVLQVANSVHFWTRVPITTVWDSVILIGTQNIASLITAIEIFDAFGKHTSPEVKAYYELVWNKALTRANIASRIATEWEEMKDPQIAYVTALLQDIGLLIRLVNEPDRYREMMHRSYTNHISMAEAELQIFTHCHTDIGAFMLQLWNFPREIVFAVAHHHGFAYDDPLTQTIQMADILSSSDPALPHDPAIDPFLDIWTVRLGNILTTSMTADLQTPLPNEADTSR
jgi:HD-like signal output (HDOD) protein